MQFLFVLAVCFFTDHWSDAEFVLVIATFYLLWQEDAMPDQIKILRERVEELEKKNRN